MSDRTTDILQGGGAEFNKDPEYYLSKRQKYGLWRGVVEDVDDPERRCRVRVRVQGIHNEDKNLLPTSALPWAEPRFAIAGDGYGDVHVPYEIGLCVWIEFVGGEPDQPVYSGGWYGENETPDEVVNGQYPKRRIIKTKKGHKIELSDEEGALEIKITDSKGNYIHLDTENDVLTIKWDGNVIEEFTGNYFRTVDGNEEILVKGDKRETVIGRTTRKMGGGMRVIGNYDYEVDGDIIERVRGQRTTTARREVKIAEETFVITAPNIYLNGHVHDD